mgnify:CR=1 FL=1
MRDGEKKEDRALYKIAKANGCRPTWYDGIFGWAWHCGCADGTHASDQQCSALNTRSARRRAT